MSLKQNSNFEFSNNINNKNPYTENNITCQRCGINPASIFCEQCKPFHKFCNQCDTAVHELSQRKQHQRIPLNKNSIQSSISNEILPIKTEAYNLVSSPNIKNKSYTLKNQLFIPETTSNLIPQINNSLFSNGRYLNYDSINNSVGINEGVDECKKVYTKNYVTELKLSHDKEKDNLLYKINTLENSINRIKTSFNDQLKNIHFSQRLNEKEQNSKVIKMNNDYLIQLKTLEESKNMEISSLKNQISNLNKNISKSQKEYQELLTKFNKLQKKYDDLERDNNSLIKDYQILKKNSTTKINELNSKLIETINEYNSYKKDTTNETENLKTENNEKLRIFSEEKQREIFDLKNNYKEEIENSKKLLTENYENKIKLLSDEISQLKKQNTMLIDKMTLTEEKSLKNNDQNILQVRELQNIINEKETKIKELNKEIEGKNSKCIEMKNDVLNINNQNENFVKEIKEKNKEIEKLKNDFTQNEKNLKNLQETNQIYADKLIATQNEIKNLKVINDTLNIEFENKLRNYKFIEDKNAMLEKENQQLKSKMENIIKPLSFSYSYVTK